MNTQSWTKHIDEGHIAWLTFDVPGAKVNTFSTSAMGELETLLDELRGDQSVKAVVFKSGKSNGFIAGADIDEFSSLKDEGDAQEKAGRGQKVFGKIKALPVPTVAVIHGACLGGGLEMALHCDYRLVTDYEKTNMGAPEVNLGILPGWGGTQLLPKLVGLPQAMGMILTGKAMIWKKARRMGLADGVVAHAFLEEQTCAFIERILSRVGRMKVMKKRASGQPRLMRMMSAVPWGRKFIYGQSRKQIMKKSHGQYPAPLEALGVIEASFGHTTLEDGLKLEAEAFGRLACTPISRHLVWLFQESTQAKKKAKGETHSLERGGVVGAGIMGAGIAWALSHAGMTVRLRDINWEAAAKGIQSCSRMFKQLVKRRKMTHAQMNLGMHRIRPGVDATGFRKLDVVVEAVAEDLDIKRTVLQDIEANVGPDTIIATNTSSLPLGELSDMLKKPDRFVGLHFFNPVNRMPLVEVVPGPGTSEIATQTAVRLVQNLGKLPIVVGDCAGFLVNRILLPYLVESSWMLEEGVKPENLDQALVDFGMPMGPLALVDEVGIDVGVKVAKVLEEAYGERMRVPAILDLLASTDGLRGKKSGRGIYTYKKGKAKSKVNPAVMRMVKVGRQQDNLSARELTAEQMVDRAVLIMVNEAARCLEEGVVESAGSLDLAMVMGTGFAPFRGGLLRYADERGLEPVKKALDSLADEFGDRFRPAPLIEKLVNEQGTFHALDCSQFRMNDHGPGNQETRNSTLTEHPEESQLPALTADSGEPERFGSSTGESEFAEQNPAA